MTDEFEARVATSLRRLSLPEAPSALRVRVEAIPAGAVDAFRSPQRRTNARRFLLLVAAVAGLSLFVGVAFLGGGASLVREPTASVRPSASGPASSMPATVDGRPTYSVSEALAQREAGKLGSEPLAVAGFWSDASVRHSCVAPKDRPGVLELYCIDGEFGITERDEPIEVIDPHGFVTPGTGPALSPFVDQDIPGGTTLFGLPRISGQPYPPVPIIVVGHFNDPRWKDCRSEAQALCKSRLVIDSIVSFNPAAVATPAPTPTPTPFPFADPPPAPYDAAACAGGAPIAVSEWTTLASLGIDIGVATDMVYVMITRDAVPIGGWYDDPNGTRYRVWARRVCYAYEWSPEAMGFEALPGTMFKEFPDGHREPTRGPFDPAPSG